MLISRTKQFIPELVDLHQKGKFPVEKMCKVYSAKDLEQALSDMRSGTVCSRPIF